MQRIFILFLFIGMQSFAQQTTYTHPCAAHKQQQSAKNYKTTRALTNDIALMATYNRPLS